MLVEGADIIFFYCSEYVGVVSKHFYITIYCRWYIITFNSITLLARLRRNYLQLSILFLVIFVHVLGDSYQSLEYLYRISKTTMSKLIPETIYLDITKSM